MIQAEISMQASAEATLALALSDMDLVRMAKGGDRDAFDRLVERHQKNCFRIAVSMLREREEAQDQVQRAFSKAFQNLEQFQGKGEFGAWLGRIVRTGCLMRIRAQRRKQFVYLDKPNTDGDRKTRELMAPAQDPERELLMGQLGILLRREVRCLPPLLRNAFQMRAIEKLPISEVAARLGVKEAAAKSRVVRAREELRERLLEHCGESGLHIPRSVVGSLPARSSYRL